MNKKIEEIALQTHIKWLPKAKTAKIDGSEMTVLPYGYLSQAVIEVIEQERERIIEEYKDALIWCSGSQDFQLEGKAREGWEKICLPLLNKK